MDGRSFERASLRRLARTSLACTIALLGACASPSEVRPWEKGDLARPAMVFDADPIEARHLGQIYFSKEAATGGSGVGGGGCGCN